MSRSNINEFFGLQSLKVRHSKERNYSAPNLSPVGSLDNCLIFDDPEKVADDEQAQKQRKLADKINNYAPVDEIRIMLVNGALANGVVTQGLTPLHYACYRDHYEACKLLLVRGAEINAVDEAGYSPIHLCAEKGHYKLLRLLIENCARVCWVEESDTKKQFPMREGCDEPLAMAIRRGHYECAKLLLECGADPNARYFSGPEITHIPPTETHFLRLLLAHGADPNVYGRDGLTPAMKACRLKDKGIKALKVLFEYGADINSEAFTKQSNMTALHFGVLSGNHDLVNFLIANGANINMPDTYDKASPMDLAVLKDDVELLKILMDAGGEPNKVHTYIGSAVHLACCSSNLKNQRAIVKLLLERGGDINLCHTFNDSDGSVLKSPMVEYFRSTDTIDICLVYVMLSFGGRVIMRAPSLDPRGQLRNLLKLSVTYPDVFNMLCDLGEDYDPLALQRIALPIQIKESLLLKTKNPKTLLQTCRVMLRNKMNPLHPGKVQNLDIPEALKNYILGMYF
uniref:SOCS box domain-containing protein n=1 Tax=Rhabditophanes sp. KR3021 TaxID=114890 RepID=A0AC35TJ86_9BILA